MRAEIPRIEKRLYWTVALCTIAAAGFLIFRTSDPQKPEFLSGTFEPLAVYGSLTLGIGIAFRLSSHIRSVAARVVLVGPALLLAALLILMALVRAVQTRSNFEFPPQAASSVASSLEKLSPSERAEWAARVAMHRVSTGFDGPLLTIPDGWSFPSDVAILVERVGEHGVRVWARASDGTVKCQASPREVMSRSCSSGAPNESLRSFIRPSRIPAPVTSMLWPRIGDPWPQYRRDGSKSASMVVTSSGSTWVNTLDGEIRSSVSLVGDLALVGAHHSGSLAAFDVATGAVRWTSRVPNWIHQDAVSDGRVVVVGFGNQWPSFAGRAPSGVAAYVATTGKHLWTQFDESSIMTSPVVRDSFVVYASAAGVVRKRSLSTGALLAQRSLPGGVIMAPPASEGDTIVLSLDNDSVCAMLMSSMETIWCRTMPFHRMTGHAAPTIVSGKVITSSLLLLRAISLREFSRLPRSLQLDLLRSIVVPGIAFAGQRFQAVRLRDGEPVWSSRAFPALRVVEGHTAGTAAVRDTVGVIVMPSADTIVGFNVRSGSILWTARAHESRGPPLLLDGLALNAGRDGITDVFEIETGRTFCRMTRAIGYDRAGPANAGKTLIFADLEGHLESVSAAAIENCDTIALRDTIAPMMRARRH